ncbi:conserved hypothetical protein [Treponema phagedenis]|uniref:Uncharacterized protein n=1 Tax=Treponema phagedenis TaxID=162 RepID=A0A0B7GWP9_TREPH|nr:conserved hypothetical protein [Treponema phagedenis]
MRFEIFQHRLSRKFAEAQYLQTAGVLRAPAIACGSFCAILGAQKGSGFALLKKRSPPSVRLTQISST